MRTRLSLVVLAAAVVLLMGMLPVSPVVAVAEEPSRVVSVVYQATSAVEVTPRWGEDQVASTWNQYWATLHGPGPRDEWDYGYWAEVVNVRYEFETIPDRPGILIREGLEYQLGYAVLQMQVKSVERYVGETVSLSLRYLEFMPYWIVCDAGNCGGLVTQVNVGETYARFDMVPELFWSLFNDREVENFTVGVGIVDANHWQRLKVPGQANPDWGEGAVTLTLYYYR